MHNDHKSVGEALTHNVAGMIVGDIASKDCSSILRSSSSGSCCSIGTASLLFNLAYDHNFLGLQMGLDKAGKELDKTGKAISKK